MYIIRNADVWQFSCNTSLYYMTNKISIPVSRNCFQKILPFYNTNICMWNWKWTICFLYCCQLWRKGSFISNIGSNMGSRKVSPWTSMYFIYYIGEIDFFFLTRISHLHKKKNSITPQEFMKTEDVRILHAVTQILLYSHAISVWSALGLLNLLSSLYVYCTHSTLTISKFCTYKYSKVLKILSL